MMVTRYAAKTTFAKTIERLDVNGASTLFEYPFTAAAVNDFLDLQNLVLEQTYYHGKNYTLLTKTVAPEDLANCNFNPR